jgi:hypothetical protein
MSITVKVAERNQREEVSSDSHQRLLSGAQLRPSFNRNTPI